MKKKFLSLALALVMCLGLSLPAFAADSDFTIEDGVLTGYSGPGGDVVIPDGVTSIGEEAFFDCQELTSVTIPEGVTSIGVNAFLNCHSLASVTFPSTLTSIENDAFVGCFSLDSVVIPSSVTSIGAGVFSYSGVTSVTIPSSVTSIGHTAFSYCISLTSLTFPSSITSISEYMFDCCEELTSVTIPSSVTSIGEYAFSECGNLTDIYYTGSEEQWNAIEIGEYNEALNNATIHYNSAGDTQQPGESANDIARAYNFNAKVDGETVKFGMYALDDANGNATNYFRLRELAYVLNGTAAQFSVGYDDASKTISLTTGQPYAASGDEMTTPFSGDRECVSGVQSVLVDGQPVELASITLTDDNGGGYNYFKLRDLGKALGFNVEWREGEGILIETDKPYAG